MSDLQCTIGNLKEIQTKFFLLTGSNSQKKCQQGMCDRMTVYFVFSIPRFGTTVIKVSCLMFKKVYYLCFLNNSIIVCLRHWMLGILFPSRSIGKGLGVKNEKTCHSYRCRHECRKRSFHIQGCRRIVGTTPH